LLNIDSLVRSNQTVIFFAIFNSGAQFKSEFRRNGCRR